MRVILRILRKALSGEKMKKEKIAELFGIQAPQSAVVEIRPKDDFLPVEAYPTPSANYVFEKNTLKKLLRFFQGVASRNNMMLIGDAGTGKTSVILETAARLGWPVFSMACSGRTRFAHAVGGRELINGDTVWRDGPLIMAMRHGGIFLANEITRLDPGEQMCFAEVLDSTMTLTIPETGEVVRAHPQFRFVATGNSGGFGDDSGAYAGEKPASLAFLDRFLKMEVNYLPPDQEIDLVMAIAPTIGREIAEKMVTVANEVRKQFVGRGGSLQMTISTRSLVIWAKETVGYSKIGIQNPILEALDDVILGGVPSETANVVRELWGEWINKT